MSYDDTYRDREQDGDNYPSEDTTSQRIPDDATFPDTSAGGTSAAGTTDSEGFTNNGDGTYNYTIDGTTYTIDRTGRILEQHDSAGRSTAGVTGLTETGGNTNGTPTPSGGGGSTGNTGNNGVQDLFNWMKNNKALTGAGIGALASFLLPKSFTEPQTHSNITSRRLNLNKRMQRTRNPGGPDANGRYFGDVTFAAEGGLMDTPQENIMVGYARGGHAGRYLQGSTDGMADQLRTSIDGHQPAALSHGEFVIPADVVSHLGNGNSDAGAKKLYQMMDKVRMARTGTKKQGRQINPDKFLGGGIAHNAFAGGGNVVGYDDGGTVATTGSVSGPSPYYDEYVSTMLEDANAISTAPYEAWNGNLTAGPSTLQTTAFDNAANLTTSPFIEQAGTAAGGIGALALQDTYNAQTQGNTFTPTGAYTAGTFGNQFTGPNATKATQFTNQYTAPADYKSTTFTADKFDANDAKSYMNPFVQQALAPQLAEMRRQAAITQRGNDSKMAQAGAFGGSRQALMTTENQRNLLDKIQDATGTGYLNAYNKAMEQYNADQGRAQKAAEDTEAYRQYGYTNKMTAADKRAGYGMDALNATEKAREFQEGQRMTAAQERARYGLSAQQEAEKSRQFSADMDFKNAGESAKYGLEGARLSQADRQFASTHGLDALGKALDAARVQGDMGVQANNAGIANLKAMLDAGAVDRGIASEDLAARIKEFEKQRDDPMTKLLFKQRFLEGLDVNAKDVSNMGQSQLAQFLALMGLGGSLGGEAAKSSTTTPPK